MYVVCSLSHALSSVECGSLAWTHARFMNAQSVHVVYICVHNKHNVALMARLSYVSFSAVQPTWESFQDARSAEEAEKFYRLVESKQFNHSFL